MCWGAAARKRTGGKSPCGLFRPSVRKKTRQEALDTKGSFREVTPGLGSVHYRPRTGLREDRRLPGGLCRPLAPNNPAKLANSHVGGGFLAPRAFLGFWAISAHRRVFALPWQRPSCSWASCPPCRTFPAVDAGGSRVRRSSLPQRDSQKSGLKRGMSYFLSTKSYTRT